MTKKLTPWNVYDQLRTTDDYKCYIEALHEEMDSMHNAHMVTQRKLIVAMDALNDITCSMVIFPNGIAKIKLTKQGMVNIAEKALKDIRKIK